MLQIFLRIRPKVSRWMGMLGVAFLLNACQDQGLKPEALGSVAEVLVVSEAEIWQGEIGRQLRKT
ncbi:MAG: hypothetical protein FJ350_03375, partial [Sphingomonadales bacterium]|nr:hypothetical protein [Sphingomonadales bacterium]